ncbi:O-acetyl-ADP-ribose deacetylase [Desulforhopalus vacuolatus]|uniref:O-acetyl-ADP-ribose deacetylase n=1 Tax=Desulforhopalus vacuolatus TaxID=40414 RepID=UPI00196368C9|nr:O-acetyl-ADP-ribose deacetylase [Desulforhopalus vacuolatus]MBM9520513.1 O-acetyl-ADP-ribose deacetylase [Desulforhopalus vacuolatus]
MTAENIEIIEGDITLAPVDAIVNAANQELRGGGGVDGAIQKAAGPELLEACRQIEAVNGVRCPFGEAVITMGYNLPATYVIHTVGPIYQQAEHPEKVLTAAYGNSLDIALSHQCRSVAFPAISCGVYGYPPEEAAKISISVCRREKYRGLKIYFYLFRKELVEIWTKALEDGV